MVHKEERKRTLFERLETKPSAPIQPGREDQIAKARIPHQVKLSRGTVPYHEALSSYQKYARILMSPFIKKYFSHIGEGSKLEMDLLKAHMKFRVEDFLAYVWFTVFLLIAAALISGVIIGALALAYKIPTPILLLVYILLALMPLIAYIVLMHTPASRASSRGKDIDKKIAHAMNFISTLASADVTIDVIFSELAKQKIYGEIQKEAQWITRDIELLGKDVLTAIREAAARTPSAKFQDFLQGVVTTTLSGGQLKPYFILKAEQYSRLAKLESKKNQETLGMLAESFVTVVVAMPLFLIVMMSLMALVGKTSGSSILLLYLIVFLMIPLSQFGFIIAIQSMTEEA
ncbi:MAG: type II secretion system F family protein [Thermoplasmata archaeon]